MAVGLVQNLSNPMPSFEGRSAGVNLYGQIPALAYTPRIVAKTAAYTVKAEESGTIFFTTGATAAVTFTLPAISDGPWYFEFYATADFAMTVAAATADTAVSFNDLAADSVAISTASEILGGGIRAVCDGTTLVIAGMPSKSHAQTVTVAS